jgi:hypothetical protein
MNMKKLLTLFIFFLLSASMQAQILVLHHANGTTTDIQLYTLPQVKFAGDKVLVTSTVLDMEYPKQDVLRFTYKGGSLGISSPNTKANYSQENGQLVFHGIKSSDKIAIHTAKGILVPARITRSGSTATLPLSAIPSGVYMLTVNGQTSKFTKR